MKEVETGQPGPDQVVAQPAVVVKKYANRRLYNTESSSYITLDNLAEMVRAGRDFIVYDARTGDDITRSVLTQIIVDEESKGRALLPTTFLRQLIGFYGESLGGVVPRYLEQTMSAIARQQEQMRDAMQQTMGTLLPPPLAEMRRHNMAMVERAMTLFSPFYRQPDQLSGHPPMPATVPDPAPSAAPISASAPTQAELQALKSELEQLRLLLAATEAAQSQAHIAPPVKAPPVIAPPVTAPLTVAPPTIAPPGVALAPASQAASPGRDGVGDTRVVAQLRPKRQEPNGG